MGKSPDIISGRNEPILPSRRTFTIASHHSGESDMQNYYSLVAIPFSSGEKQHISPTVLIASPSHEPQRKERKRFLPAVKTEANTAALAIETTLGIHFTEIPALVPDSVRNRVSLGFNALFGFFETDDPTTEHAFDRVTEGFEAESAAGFHLPGANIFVDKEGTDIVRAHESMHSWIDQHADPGVLRNRRELYRLLKNKSFNRPNPDAQFIITKNFFFDMVSEGICEYGAIETELAAGDNDWRKKNARLVHNVNLTGLPTSKSLFAPDPIFMRKQFELTQSYLLKMTSQNKEGLTTKEFEAKYSVGYYFVATVMRYLGANGVPIDQALSLILKHPPRDFQTMMKTFDYANDLAAEAGTSMKLLLSSGWDEVEPEVMVYNFWKTPLEEQENMGQEW